MGKLYRMIAACLLVSSCSGRSDQLATSSAPRSDRRRAKAGVEQAPDPRLDAEGKLKAGPFKVLWLEIPAGFKERSGNSERLSAYDVSGLPLSKVREYLQARLSSDQVSYPAGGVSFKQARPTHTQLAMPPLDVMLLETDRAKGELRLLVETNSYPSGAKPLSDSNAAQALLQDRNRRE